MENGWEEEELLEHFGGKMKMRMRYVVDVGSSLDSRDEGQSRCWI